MIYDLNGNALNAAFDMNGNSLDVAYDVGGNIVFQKGTPAQLPIASRHDVILSQDHMYVCFDGRYLSMTLDGGKTFPKKIDITGIIPKNIHVFTNGTLNVFTHTMAYYSDDWETLHEATVLDGSGNPYEFSTYDTFTTSRHNPQRIFVGGYEMYIFGNYCLTNEYSQKKNVWYTTDYGHTYKPAYEFGTSMVRHVHNVYFNPVDSSFWTTTGDSNAESYVMKGFYDAQNDSWSWSVIGNGYYYKWAGMDIYDGYIYWALDHSPGQVRRCPYNYISDESKHSIILQDLPNDCINVIIDHDTGEMLVSLSTYGGSYDTCRRLYYSADRLNFDYVLGEPPEYYPYNDTMYYGIHGVNADKKILSGLWSDGNDNILNWDKVPSVWLDDIVRSKFPNAFPLPVSPIPSEYQQVEWIHPENGAAISLLVPFSSATVTVKATISYENVPSTEEYIVANGTDSATMYYFLLGMYQKFVFLYTRQNQSTLDPRADSQAFNGAQTIDITAALNATAGTKALKANTSEASKTYSGGITAAESPIYLFRGRLNSNACWFTGRLHSLSIESATVNFNLIPCYRKSDSVIGLYDTVSKTFLVNAGTGSFTKGADVT